MILPTSPVKVANTSTVLKQRAFDGFVGQFSLYNLLGECEQPDVVLWVRPKLGETDEIDAVLLSIKTGWKIITVALVVAVVETKKMNLKLLYFFAESRLDFRRIFIENRTEGGNLHVAAKDKWITYQIIVLSSTIVEDFQRKSI